MKKILGIVIFILMLSVPGVSAFADLGADMLDFEEYEAYVIRPEGINENLPYGALVKISYEYATPEGMFVYVAKEGDYPLEYFAPVDYKESKSDRLEEPINGVTIASTELRTGPAYAYPVSATLEADTPITITQIKGSFAYVKCDDKEGWTLSERGFSSYSLDIEEVMTPTIMLSSDELPTEIHIMAETNLWDGDLKETGVVLPRGTVLPVVVGMRDRTYAMNFETYIYQVTYEGKKYCVNPDAIFENPANHHKEYNYDIVYINNVDNVKVFEEDMVTPADITVNRLDVFEPVEIFLSFRGKYNKMMSVMADGNKYWIEDVYRGESDESVGIGSCSLWDGFYCKDREVEVDYYSDYRLTTKVGTFTMSQWHPIAISGAVPLEEDGNGNILYAGKISGYDLLEEDYNKENWDNYYYILLDDRFVDGTSEEGLEYDDKFGMLYYDTPYITEDNMNSYYDYDNDRMVYAGKLAEIYSESVSDVSDDTGYVASTTKSPSPTALATKNPTDTPTASVTFSDTESDTSTDVEDGVSNTENVSSVDSKGSSKYTMVICATAAGVIAILTAVVIVLLVKSRKKEADDAQ